ncbi:extensin-like [Triticum urartu]|uniref:extensin-like n=1 Tax=Triticum urartu TaxID=4572 RepID=UPI002043BB8C|nr:extensin-like [Triticum urartu]
MVPSPLARRHATPPSCRRDNSRLRQRSRSRRALERPQAATAPPPGRGAATQHALSRAVGPRQPSAVSRRAVPRRTPTARRGARSPPPPTLAGLCPAALSPIHRAEDLSCCCLVLPAHIPLQTTVPATRRGGGEAAMRWCYVGKATKIFFAVVAGLAVVGLIVAVGAVIHRAKSHRNSGAACATAAGGCQPVPPGTVSQQPSMPSTAVTAPPPPPNPTFPAPETPFPPPQPPLQPPPAPIASPSPATFASPPPPDVLVPPPPAIAPLAPEFASQPPPAALVPPPPAPESASQPPPAALVPPPASASQPPPVALVPPPPAPDAPSPTAS